MIDTNDDPQKEALNDILILPSFEARNRNVMVMTPSFQIL